MVSVSFLPTALGPQSGTITLSANPGGSVVLMVTGSGTPTATVSSLTAIPSVVAGCVPITAVVAQAQSLRSDLIVEFDPGTGTFQRATQGSSAPGSGEGAQGLTTSPAGVSHTFLWNTDADFSRTTVSNVRVRVSAAVSGQGGGAGAGVTQAGIAVRNGLAFAAPVNVGGASAARPPRSAT